MADGEDSRHLDSRLSNGYASNSDISNVSAANSSTTSFSKFWSMAQNLTKSVFSRSSVSNPAPSRPLPQHRIEVHRRPYEGYVSNDEEETEESVPDRQISDLPARIEDSSEHISVNKRPLAAALDHAVAFPASKRSKIVESTPATRSETSNSVRSRRFWTSESSSRPTYHRPVSASIFKPLLLSTLEKKSEKSNSAAPSPNIFNITPRTLSRPVTAMSNASSSAASFSSLRTVSEITRTTAARNSETKRILMDLERVGTLTTTDSKRPRLWFQSIPEEVSTTRLLEVKRSSVGPPTSSLRTVEKAQVLPAVSTPLFENASQSFRRSRDERAPPIPAAVKRIATAEANEANVPKDKSTLFGKSVSASSCKFTFSKPLPISVRPIAETVSAKAAVDSAKPKWSCSMCFVSNDATSNECACCKTPKPNLQSKPQNVDGWWCGLCSVKNGNTAEKCVACGTERSSKKAPSTAATIPEQRPAASVVPDEPKWSCSECFVSNNASAKECACCKTAKPVAKSKPTDGDIWWCGSCSIKNQAAADKCMACGTERSSKKAAPAVDKTKKIETAVAPPISSKPKWSCSSCFVSNDSSATECACCKVPKPNVQAKAAGGEMWWCPCCSVKNDITLTKCVSCGTERVARSEIANVGQGDIKKPNWSCTTCFVSNAGDRVKCIACQSPKPGGTYKPVSLGTSVFGVPVTTTTTVTVPAAAFADVSKFSLPAIVPTTTTSEMANGVPKLAPPAGFLNPSSAAVFGTGKMNGGKVASSPQLAPKESATDGLFRFGTPSTAASTNPLLAPPSTLAASSGFNFTGFGSTTSSFSTATTVTTSVAPTAAVTSTPTIGILAVEPASVTSGKASGDSKAAAPSAAVFPSTTTLFGIGKVNGGNVPSLSQTAPKETPSDGLFRFGAPSTTTTTTTTTSGNVLAAPAPAQATSSGFNFVFGSTTSSSTTTAAATVAFGGDKANGDPKLAPAAGFLNPSTTAIFGMGKANGGRVASSPQLAPKESANDALFRFGASSTTASTNPLPAPAPVQVASGGFNFTGFGSTPTFSTATTTSTLTFGGEKANGESKLALPPAFSSATALFGMGKMNGGKVASSPQLAPKETTNDGLFRFAAPTTTNSFSLLAAPASTQAVSGGFSFTSFGTTTLSDTATTTNVTPASDLFGTKNSNPPLPTGSFFPSLPASNPFNVTGSPSATPIGARRQLVAKRKAKRP